MKIRTGLVSNSSASSFICAFSRIIDKEKFEVWNKKNKLNLVAHQGLDLVTNPDPQVREDFFNDLVRDFYDYIDKEQILADLEQDPDSYYLLTGGNGYGEDSFYWDDEYSEYDYSRVDEDDFNDPERSVYYAGKEEGLEQLQSCLYAGRDG